MVKFITDKIQRRPVPAGRLAEVIKAKKYFEGDTYSDASPTGTAPQGNPVST
jgi:hypothetical protein